MRKLLFAASLVIVASTTAFAGSCDVTVTFPDGHPAKGIKLGGAVAGIIGSMVKNVYTDSNGKATLTWSDDSQYSSLETVFVDGDDKHTSCKNGYSVSFVVKP
jgi:hypothetical protein